MDFIGWFVWHSEKWSSVVTWFNGNQTAWPYQTHYIEVGVDGLFTVVLCRVVTGM